MCKSIIKGLARRNRERHAMLADVEEEQEHDVICFDDITGKELPWRAVRKAREVELKYLRDLGVYEKVDEKEAVEKYGVTPVDTKWFDTDKAVRGGAHADQITNASSVGGAECNNIDRSEPQENVFNHAHRRVTCVLPREGPETRADTATSGRQDGHRRWESWTDEEEHVRRGQQSGT